MRKGPFAVVTGGGTGGHVTPALAVAEALVAAGHDRGEILFVGGRRGIESRLVPQAGFSLVALPGRGIKRSLSPDNLAAGLGLAWAALRASKMALLQRPRVVVTVGGYAGFAYALAAVLWRIPLVVVTVDAKPGAVNRLVAPFAAANAVALPGTALPRATLTGAPVRRSLLEARRGEEARQALADRLRLGPGRRVVLLTGGSLGAGSINSAALELAGRWAARSDIALYHVAGERNLAAVRRAAEEAGLFAGGPDRLEYRLVGFDGELVAALAGCDVAVCRAGATTVAELSALGVPSVLVPLPGAPGDHQTANATVLARAGAAVLLEDGACRGEQLAEILAECLDTPGRLEEMATAAKELGRNDGAEQVVALIERAARREGRAA